MPLKNPLDDFLSILRMRGITFSQPGPGGGGKTGGTRPKGGGATDQREEGGGLTREALEGHGQTVFQG